MAGITVNENNVVYRTIEAAIAAAGYTIDLETVLQHGAGKERRTAIADILTATNQSADPATINIEEGRNAGCGQSFGITTGAQSEEQLATKNPTVILNSLRELLRHV
ncbi:MAG: hypothetical protein AAFP90_19330 [Planctomycetota bacterium]